MLSKIRPELPILVSDDTSAAERFQNTTLRPILKLQNDLLMEVFRAYLRKRKTDFNKMSEREKLAFIDHGIKTDQRFKNLLTGLIAGHFTAEEWQTYEAEERELNRRLSGLLVQRLQSQLV